MSFLAGLGRRITDSLPGGMWEFVHALRFLLSMVLTNNSLSDDACETWPHKVFVWFGMETTCCVGTVPCHVHTQWLDGMPHCCGWDDVPVKRGRVYTDWSMPLVPEGCTWPPTLPC